MKFLRGFHIIVFLILSLPAMGQVDSLESYFYWRTKGLESIEGGNFEDAINEFKLAKTLNDTPSNSDIEILLDSAYQRYITELSVARAELNDALTLVIEEQAARIKEQEIQAALQADLQRQAMEILAYSERLEKELLTLSQEILPNMDRPRLKKRSAIDYYRNRIHKVIDNMRRELSYLRSSADK